METPFRLETEEQGAFYRNVLQALKVDFEDVVSEEEPLHRQFFHEEWSQLGHMPIQGDRVLRSTYEEYADPIVSLATHLSRLSELVCDERARKHI